MDNEGSIVAMNRDYIPTKGIWMKQLPPVLHPKAGTKKHHQYRTSAKQGGGLPALSMWSKKAQREQKDGTH